jgi:hypothetical protein
MVHLRLIFSFFESNYSKQNLKFYNFFLSLIIEKEKLQNRINRLRRRKHRKQLAAKNKTRKFLKFSELIIRI